MTVMDTPAMYRYVHFKNWRQMAAFINAFEQHFI